MKKDVMKAIRAKCLDCCCDQPGEVRLCTVKNCPLYPFRMGKDPTAKRTRKLNEKSNHAFDFIKNKGS